MIGGLNSDTHEGKLKELCMQSLADRRREADMVMIFKVIRGFCPVNKNYWPKLASEHGENTHGTRAAADPYRLRQPFARNDRRGKFFSVRACEWWNNLPLNIKQAKSIGQFKRLYRLFAASTPSEAMVTAGAV
jgi:hypothetical protein